jgi:hypothetical protein
MNAFQLNLIYRQQQTRLLGMIKNIYLRLFKGHLISQGITEDEAGKLLENRMGISTSFDWFAFMSIPQVALATAFLLLVLANTFMKNNF